jgi:hypothetical protein
MVMDWKKGETPSGPPQENRIPEASNDPWKTLDSRLCGNDRRRDEKAFFSILPRT